MGMQLDIKVCHYTRCCILYALVSGLWRPYLLTQFMAVAQLHMQLCHVILLCHKIAGLALVLGYGVADSHSEL